MSNKKSKQNMLGIELQALRKMLFLDVAEAAEHIGDVSTRSWQYWEAGKVPVPADVADYIREFADMRLLKLHQMREEAQAVKSYRVHFYQRYEDYKAAGGRGSPVFWRITQSATAQLYEEGIAAIYPYQADETTK